MESAAGETDAVRFEAGKAVPARKLVQGLGRQVGRKANEDVIRQKAALARRRNPGALSRRGACRADVGRRIRKAVGDRSRLGNCAQWLDGRQNWFRRIPEISGNADPKVDA